MIFYYVNIPQGIIFICSRAISANICVCFCFLSPVMNIEVWNILLSPGVHMLRVSLEYIVKNETTDWVTGCNSDQHLEIMPK